MGPAWAPAHLLLLDHAFADYLVDRGFDERGRDGLPRPVALAVVGDAAGVAVGGIGVLVSAGCEAAAASGLASTSGALVDPPIAELTTIMFSNAARVMIFDGRKSSQTISTIRLPVR